MSIQPFTHLHHEPKLVSQRRSGQEKYRHVATFDNEEYITMPSINIINSVDNFTILEEIKYLKLLLIVINSFMYNYLYKQLFAETNINITSQVFQTIPISKNLFLQDQQLFKNIIDKIMKHKVNNEDTIDLETQLDSAELFPNKVKTIVLNPSEENKSKYYQILSNPT